METLPGAVAIGGFALEVLVQTIKRIVDVLGIQPPDNFYLYLTAGLSVLGTAVLAFGPLVGVDLTVVGGTLSEINTVLEYLVLLAGLPSVAVAFRWLQKFSAS